MALQRYLVTLSFVSFTPQLSGDLTGNGEFYFKINRRRFPNKGNIQLAKHQTFRAPANWILYCGIHDFSEEIQENLKDHVKFRIQCFENDPVLDDTIINREEIMKLAVCNNDFVLKSADEKFELRLHITMELTSF